MADDIEVLKASNAFRDTLIPRADMTWGGPMWHGWALHEAFAAGVAYREAHPKTIHNVPEPAQPRVFTRAELLMAAKPETLVSLADTWVECSVVGLPQNIAKPVTCLFVNSYTKDGMKAFAPGGWRVVDCTGMVPAGTKAVGLTMLLVITHGTGNEIADLRVAFRRHGATKDNHNNYSQQAIEAYVNGGVRTNAFEIVPLSSDLKFEVYWQPAVMGEWPAWSSYCLNVGIACYFR